MKLSAIGFYRSEVRHFTVETSTPLTLKGTICTPGLLGVVGVTDDGKLWYCTLVDGQADRWDKLFSKSEGQCDLTLGGAKVRLISLPSEVLVLIPNWGQNEKDPVQLAGYFIKKQGWWFSKRQGQWLLKPPDKLAYKHLARYYNAKKYEDKPECDADHSLKSATGVFWR